jgi:hypothetical protein
MENDLHLLCMIGQKERIQELLTQEEDQAQRRSENVNDGTGNNHISIIRRLSRVRLSLSPSLSLIVSSEIF